jgi:cation:H+ antiporter
MAPVLALPLFIVALAVTLSAAATFARQLDRLGARFGLSEVLIGLLTAVAADLPEVSSALVSLFKGADAASVGVIVGASAFNLAAMIGLSALLVGAVAVHRESLLFEGSVGAVVSAAVIALLLGWLPASVAAVLIACALLPYLTLIVGGRRLAARLRLDRLADRVLDRPPHVDGERLGAHHAVHFATHRQLGMIVLDLVAIIAGSFGIVEAALSLGDRWGVRPALVGVLVLGPLAAMPNALTGVRLGLARRGAALVTETLNSNTINLVAGVALPALFVTLTERSASDRIGLALLAGGTALTLGLLARRGGVRRLGGALIIGVYAAFVIVAVR